MPPNLRGILWVGMSGVLFALLNVFTLIPSQHLNPYVMAFMRYFFGTLMLLPIVLKLGLHRSMSTNRLPLHLFRGCIHACGMFLWFVGLPLTTLASVTALGFTGPIFVTIGAAMFLGEKVRLRRWMAVAVGFAGAMIIIRPGVGDLGLGAICILISTPIFSASNLISKALARTESANKIVIWQHLTILIFACPVALWFWQTPSPDRSPVVRRRGPVRHAGPHLPAERLSARRHHPAAADRLPVAPVERAARLLPVLPATRCLDLRRRGGDLRQRALHLPP